VHNLQAHFEVPPPKEILLKRFLLASLIFTAAIATAQTNNPNYPTWWNKYQQLIKNGTNANPSSGGSLSVGSNVDVSNECAPQSEVFITVNPAKSKALAAGSNEIYRLPMRGYFSTDNGSSWGGVDLPLPAPKGNGTRFGSDPTLAFDTKGSVFYGYIVVFFGNGSGVNGTEMAVAHSSDGGATYPNVTFFNFSNGSDHFNDKPMIAADTNLNSPFRDNVYLAWDAASGGSISGGVLLARSSDHGASFAVTRIDAPSGQGRAIGADPFVGPDGELYVAWNDWSNNAIVVNRSFDGGVTWGAPTVVSRKNLQFDIAIPAEFSRGALVYPACDVDRSGGIYNGRLYCSWMDKTANGTTDIFLSYSDDYGNSWTKAVPVGDRLNFLVDRFNHWLSVDPTNGAVNVAFYDTRNDLTGSRYMTDYYITQSQNGGVSFSSPNTRVSDSSSNEHDCNGVFPCSAIDYGNQQGDYAGLVSFGGTSHPIWVDSRRNQQAITGCKYGAMEEVFTATVK
jgi:hypothetical protein